MIRYLSLVQSEDPKAHEEKRKQYYKLLLDKKIKEPKEQTLLYYKIFKDYSNSNDG